MGDRFPLLQLLDTVRRRADAEVEQYILQLQALGGDVLARSFGDTVDLPQLLTSCLWHRELPTRDTTHVGGLGPSPNVENIEKIDRPKKNTKITHTHPARACKALLLLSFLHGVLL